MIIFLLSKTPLLAPLALFLIIIDSKWSEIPQAEFVQWSFRFINKCGDLEKISKIVDKVRLH